jgi:two-component system chemotaxis response regulator CheY
MAKRVLSVGQCAMDHGSISYLMSKHFGADVIGADSKDEALAAARKGNVALALVNRVLDRDGSPGLDIIRALKGDAELKNLPVMLVSNYEDAQREAESCGALRGFGKAALDQPQTIAAIGAVLQGDGAGRERQNSTSQPAK